MTAWKYLTVPIHVEHTPKLRTAWSDENFGLAKAIKEAKKGLLVHYSDQKLFEIVEQGCP